MTTQTSNSNQNVFVGIDFGTTKTMVARYDAVNKSPKPLTFGRGKFEKPTSMYATVDGDLLFGDDADDEGITDFPNHIRRFKMKLGNPGLAHVGRKTGTAKELTAEYLGHLREQIENQALHTSVDRVVVTVPAMFGPAQRQDLTEAARQAGFSQVELLEEPVAAGIAYCEQQSDLSEQLRFIVVDWGGGTFDVAHLERCQSGEIRIYEDFVVGLDDIGGEIFDDQLWEIASEALDSLGHGKLGSQPREEWGRYRRDLSRAKERLSRQSSVSMMFTLADGQTTKISLDRNDFNNIIAPLIQKASSFLNELLVRTHNSGCPPDFILLAGGTARIPFIGEELERITGVKCRQWSDGREAIALGAAIKAKEIWGTPSSVRPKDKDNVEKEKMASMAQYQKLLEAAWLDQQITHKERIFLTKERKNLGLTVEESLSLQIQVLGKSIAEVVNDSFKQALENARVEGLITHEEYRNFSQENGSHSQVWKLIKERRKSRSSPPPSDPIIDEYIIEHVTIPHRTEAFTLAASMFSLGLYNFYLTAKNAQEIAYLTKKRRLDFLSIIILSIITLGVFAAVYQFILSNDLQDYSKRMAPKERTPGLHIIVLCGNIGAYATVLFSGFTLIAMSIILPALVIWQIQKELNLYAAPGKIII